MHKVSGILFIYFLPYDFPWSTTEFMWISSGGEEPQWYYWFMHMDWIELIHEKIMLTQNSLGSAFSMFLHMHAYLISVVSML